LGLVNEGREKMSEAIHGMIDDIRTTPGASLSREGCLDMADYIDELESKLANTMDRQAFIEWLEGKLEWDWFTMIPKTPEGIAMLRGANTIFKVVLQVVKDENRFK
jgi:hypothetical protein